MYEGASRSLFLFDVILVFFFNFLPLVLVYRVGCLLTVVM